ncbi:hypothetical protein F2Q68_00018353, partial [Brassica cretica]
FMYYQNQHQGKSILSSSRMHLPSERHPFLRGGNNSPGDSGLILSTDAKPRLKWTPDLHERFIEAVNQLGGADKATPKTIMKVMGIPGLTLYHLKSHLQKYRLSKNLNGQANSGLNKIDSNQVNIIDQVQRHLQLRIEAQGKYLQSVLEKAQETLGRQNLSPAGIEAAKVQLSELVSKVSAEYPNTSFLDSKEFQNLCPQQMQTAYPQDSCLTSSEGAQKNPKMLGLRTYLGDSTSEQKEVIEEPLFQRMELTWTEGLRGNPYLSTMVSDAEQRISLGVGMHGHRGHQQGNNAYNKEERFNDKSEDHKLETQSTKTELDLNTHVENYCTTRPKQFDLNGFSWN